MTDSLGNALTPEQEAFFEKSAIRDGNGRLLTLWRGTSGKVDLFGRRLNWFTADEGYAKTYTDLENTGNGTVYSVYIDCRNPLDCGNTDLPCFELLPIMKPWRPTKALQKIMDRLKMGRDELEEILEATEADHSKHNGYGFKIYELIRHRAFIGYMLEKGFDCLKTYEGPSHSLCFGVPGIFANRIKEISNEKPTDSENIHESLDPKTHALSGDVHWWKNPEDDSWNPTEIIDGRRARIRVGTLIIKDGKEVLLGEEESEPGVFSLPGGAINKGESVEEAAKRETEEETFLEVLDPIYTGIDYVAVGDDVAEWVKEHVPEEEWWVDYKTLLVIGEYGGKYGGSVDEHDVDPNMYFTSKFYPIEEAAKDPSFKEPWKKALRKFGYMKPELEEKLRLDERWFDNEDEDFEIFAFESPYQAKDKLISSKSTIWRTIDDTDGTGMIFLGDASNMVHAEMLDQALKDGWELLGYDEDSDPLEWLEGKITGTFVPKGVTGVADWRTEDDFYFGDCYFDRYDYPEGSFYIKGNDVEWYPNTELAKALGKPLAHYRLSKKRGSDKPRLTLVEETKRHALNEEADEPDGEDEKINMAYFRMVSDGDEEGLKKAVEEAAFENGYETKVWRVEQDWWYEKHPELDRRKWEESNGVFYASDPSYFKADGTEHLGYAEEVAELYYLKLEDLDVFRPIEEYGMNAYSWKDIRCRKSDLDSDMSKFAEKIEEIDGEEWAIFSTDKLALFGKELGCDITVFEDVPYDDEAYTEYAVHNSNAVKSGKPITFNKDGIIVFLTARFDDGNLDINEQAEHMLEEE